MAITQPSDVFVPQVVGDLAIDVAFNKTDLLTSGFIKDARVDAIDKGGNNISFPFWNSFGDVQTLPYDGSAVTPDKLTMSSDEESIGDKIISLSFTIQELQDISRMANQTQFVAEGVAKKFGADVQSTLISTAVSGGTGYTVASSGAVSYNDMLKAMVTNWSENAFDNDVLFVCHPNVAYDLTITDQAQKAQLYGASPTVTDGVVQKIAGANVLPLKSITKTSSTYHNLLIKRDQLALYMKMELTPYEYKVPNSAEWQVYWIYRFATHLYKNYPLGAIVFNCTSSLG